MSNILAFQPWATSGGGAPSGPAHRYWRIRIPDSFNLEYTSINEVEMAESLGGADIATTGFAIAGDSRSGWPATDAFDDDDGTDSNNAWSVLHTTAEGDRWIGQDFGAGNEKEIVEVRLRSRNATDHGASHMPMNWFLEYSDDGTNWTTKWSRYAEAPWGQSETRTITGSIDNRTGSGPARYWRLLLIDAEYATHMAIAELEMRESVGGADVTTTGFAISGDNRSGFPDTEAFDDTVSGNNAWGVTKQFPAVDTWVGQDFGAGNEKDIVEVALTARADSFPKQNPNGFYVQCSDDGTNWETVWTVHDESASWTSSEQRVYTKP